MPTLKMDVNPWIVPNFVSLRMPPGKRQDGWTPAPGLPLSEVDPRTLADMCAAFRAEIFRKAGKMDPDA